MSVTKVRTRIEVFQISAVRSSLVGDLTLTAPDELQVVGCEVQAGSITRTFNRLQGQRKLLIVSHGRPPRGEFDLWDFGTDVLICDQHTPHRSEMRFERSENCRGLIPVRTSEEDLMAAHEIAASPLFESGRCAFVVLKTSDSQDRCLGTLASIGPVAPIQLSFRNVEPFAVGTQRVRLSDQATAEGEALWEWLLTFISVAQG